jgi:DNA-binding transcriptional MerR regulator
MYRLLSIRLVILIEISAYFNFNLQAPLAIPSSSMPKPKPVLNAFTAQQVKVITGLSVHMVNYLAREGYLTPAYDQGHIRGKTRYYSYRDLVVARIVQRLREIGLELKRLKPAIKLLSSSETWLSAGKERAISLLATDGKTLFYPDERGALIELTRGGQRSFAFVLDVAKAQAEVKRRLTRKQLDRFEIRNRPLKFDTSDSRSSRSAKVTR